MYQTESHINKTCLKCYAPPGGGKATKMTNHVDPCHDRRKLASMYSVALLVWMISINEYLPEKTDDSSFPQRTFKKAHTFLVAMNTLWTNESSKCLAQKWKSFSLPCYASHTVNRPFRCIYCDIVYILVLSFTIIKMIYIW